MSKQAQGPRRPRKSTRFNPPKSGRVVGAVVRALKLKHPTLLDRTARRYFNGELVMEDSRADVIKAVAEALIESGFLSDMTLMPRLGISLSDLLPLLIKAHIERWDAVGGEVRSATSPVRDSQLAAVPYLRLAVIDIALRVSAIAKSTGVPPPGEDAPSWSLIKGKGQVLRELMKELRGKVTREDLAEHLGVSNNTLDQWLSGKSRPANERLVRVAQEFAELLSAVDPNELISRLKRHYGLCDLCDILAVRVGRESVIELGTAFNRIVTRTMSALGQATLTQAAIEVDEKSLVVFGSQSESAASVLSLVWGQEEDPIWRSDLMAAPGDWVSRLQFVARGLSTLEEGQEELIKRLGIPSSEYAKIQKSVVRSVQGDQTRMAPGLDGQTVVRVSGDAEYSANNRMVQALQADSEGDLGMAIVHARRAVELQPEEADHHFFLGAYLGQAGEIEEGIAECWVASSLSPQWDKPRTEIGIIYINQGRYEEARQHLQLMADEIDELTPHMAWMLGHATMWCKEPQAALGLFEFVLNAEPENATVIDSAAFCHFLLGNKVEGARLAKSAAQLGVSTTYDAWRAGQYGRAETSEGSD